MYTNEKKITGYLNHTARKSFSCPFESVMAVAKIVEPETGHQGSGVQSLDSTT